MKSLTLLLAFSICLGCSQSPDFANQNSNPEPQLEATPDDRKPPIYIHISQMSASELCNRLISIDTLPTRDPNITDPIYESLIAKGEEALPCLIEKITDTTSVPDPRYSVPPWQHYKVGDTAVFVLLDIASAGDDAWERLMRESLPKKSAEEWETNGIYAYFNYVSEPKNRKELQRWWKNWLSKK